MIEIDGITKVYGEARAVDNVSLTVERGELAAIVGTSGSGKTTLMRMINRLVEPTSGTIRIDGRDNRDLPAARSPKTSPPYRNFSAGTARSATHASTSC
jgi:osmoprotectant transport system ATP-binding protein